MSKVRYNHVNISKYYVKVLRYYVKVCRYYVKVSTKILSRSIDIIWNLQYNIFYIHFPRKLHFIEKLFRCLTNWLKTMLLGVTDHHFTRRWAFEWVLTIHQGLPNLTMHHGLPVCVFTPMKPSWFKMYQRGEMKILVIEKLQIYASIYLIYPKELRNPEF